MGLLLNCGQLYALADIIFAREPGGVLYSDHMLLHGKQGCFENDQSINDQSIKD